MTPSTPQRNARVVMSCTTLQPNIDFFIEELGFRLDGISPADDPRVALLSGFGISVELRVGESGTPALLHIESEAGESRDLQAPNGAQIELRPAPVEMTLPAIQQELIVTRLEGEESWGTGRAGMQYRDLIPGRLGGRFIASHIRIPNGGPVPDVVHYHHIRFQMIFCVSGWVRVAYQDQGEPQLLEAGDCFLQPPGMRHQVLESSDGLEVIEIASPAEHNTWVDHELTLPSTSVDRNREYGGQRFVFHKASNSPWVHHVQKGLEWQDVGIAAGTRELAQVHVLRSTGSGQYAWPSSEEFLFVYVLRGTLDVELDGHETIELGPGDCANLPPGESLTLSVPDDGVEWLEIRL